MGKNSEDTGDSMCDMANTKVICIQLFSEMVQN
jgi:hypothetical protein